MESLCIFTGTDVISYFRLAANRVQASATVADFAVTKRSLRIVSEAARARTFKVYHYVALDSLYISTVICGSRSGTSAVAFRIAPPAVSFLFL